jgi:dual specificity MAP kinase phosphatase
MDFSRITEDLFIGTTPAAGDYGLLHDLSVRLVINMRWEHRLRPDTHAEPLPLLWLRTIDSPFFPIPMRALQRGARAALKTIRAGGKVYTHCAGGRHRGVAMGAAVLIAQGYGPQDAMELIKARRPVSDPGVFYIRNRILRFARQWDSLADDGGESSFNIPGGHAPKPAKDE